MPGFVKSRIDDDVKRRIAADKETAIEVIYESATGATPKMIPYLRRQAAVDLIASSLSSMATVDAGLLRPLGEALLGYDDDAFVPRLVVEVRFEPRQRKETG